MTTSQPDVIAAGRVLSRIAAQSIAAVFLCAPHAATAAKDGTVVALEEVTVTTRRYEENLQDVPVSVGVMNAAFLEAQNIDKIRDIIDKSPGTSFTWFNKMQEGYSMRGLSSQTEGAAGDPSVLTVVDDVVIAKNWMKSAEFFDVERAEILRGPQGTSFGRNTTGGLVHIVSRMPAMEPEAMIQATGGTHGLWEMDGVVGGAVSGNSAGRLAVHYRSHDGFTRDVIRNVNLGSEENLSVRGSLLLNPTDNTEIYLKVEYSEDNDDAPIRKSRDCVNPQERFTNFVDPCDPWRTAISESRANGEPFDLDRQLLNLTARVVWDLSDRLRLTSVTAYLDGEGHYNMDSAGTPRDINFSISSDQSTQFTQELRLDNHGSGQSLRWLAGVFYLTDDHDREDGREWFQEDFSIYPGPPRPATFVGTVSNNQTESYGLFGEISAPLSERLTGTAGVRYSYDDKDFIISHNGSGSRGPVTNFILAIPANGGPCPPGPVCTLGFNNAATTHDWDHVSYRASLDFAVNDDLMLYGTISEAYKTGGFNNEPQTAADAVIPYNEETALSYELGMKSVWLDRFRVNASVFYVEYDDQQVNVFRTGLDGFTTQAIDNAAQSEVYGIELDYTWQVTDGFRVSGTLARFDAEFKDTLLQVGPGPTDVADISGNRPLYVPEWTATLVAELEFPLANGSRLAFRGDWRGRGSIFNDILNDPHAERPGTDIFGARIAWTSQDEKWRVALWGRNLTEEADVVNVGPPPPPYLNDNPTGFGPPREYGGTVSFRFR